MLGMVQILYYLRHRENLQLGIVLTRDHAKVTMALSHHVYQAALLCKSCLCDTSQAIQAFCDAGCHTNLKSDDYQEQ